MENILVGMDKSFSGPTGCESFTTANTIPDQELHQWSMSTDPAGITVDFQQVGVPPRSTHNKINGDWRSLPSSTVTCEAPVEGNIVDLEQNNKTHGPRNSIFTGTKSSEQQSKVSHPRLSREPCTKAQQQGHALNKKTMNCFAKFSEDPSAHFNDLELGIFHILCKKSSTVNGDAGSPHNGSSDSPAAKDTIEAVKAISNFLRQYPGLTFSQSRRAGQGNFIDPKVCDMCGWAVARACDLKKHMKRHEKPYGCTYPKCHKRFGAKSDWKRHENSQHFQPEAFRCGQASQNGTKCGEHFLRSRDFEKHLQVQHGFSSPEHLIKETRRRRIGKNCQEQFWCGFCQDVIVLKMKRNAAWDERFDHIAEHFQKDKKKIEEWICVEENKSKRELLTDTDGCMFGDEDDKRTDTIGEADSTLSHSAMPYSQASPPTPPPPPPPAAQTSILNNNGKRTVLDNSSGHRKKKYRIMPTSNERLHYCVCIVLTKTRIWLTLAVLLHVRTL